MKKIITLSLAIGFAFAVQAQTSAEEARRVILGEGSTKQNPRTTDNRGQNPRDVILGGDNRNTRTSYPGYPERREGRRYYGKKYKKDNGKHKGWYKGKGHRKNHHGGRHDHD